MEIVYKSIDELIEYDNNPRANEEAAAKIAESIEEFGFVNPISITPGNLIISGHARLKAARRLGLEKVPCIIHDMDEGDARLARIIDNKSAEYATWDVSKLQAELQKTNVSMSFFASGYRGLHERTNDIRLAFGNSKIPITEPEYFKLKAAFDEYVDKNKSYLGFIAYIIGDKITA